MELEWKQFDQDWGGTRYKATGESGNIYNVHDKKGLITGLDGKPSYVRFNAYLPGGEVKLFEFDCTNADDAKRQCEQFEKTRTLEA